MRNYQLAAGIFGSAASKLAAQGAVNGDTWKALAVDAVNAAEAFDTEFHSRPSLPPFELKEPDVPL